MCKEFICIGCPAGCALRVRLNNNALEEVLGSRCGVGRRYAEQECLMPMRTLSALMRCLGKEKPFPVKANGLLPKEKVLECALEIRRFHPAPPIRAGEVLITDICGTGRDIVAVADYDDD